MKNTEIRHFLHFSVIERTEMSRTVTSDCVETRLGNDATKMTRSDPKCMSGHRTVVSLLEKSSKSVPHVVS